MLIRRILFACLLLCSAITSNAQIEVDHITIRDFKATGFGGFLNFSFPVSDANYVTAEVGFQYFKNKYGDDAGLIPALLGYRYTLNQTGTGLYVEPNAGYCFGGSSIQVYDENGGIMANENGDDWLYEKVNGPMAGMNLGYLFEFSGRVQFNLAFRYEHTFSKAPSNLFAFRISHAITFRRRDEW